MGRDKKKEKVRIVRDKKPRFDISQETKNSIWGVVSIILAVITVLSFVGYAGRAGRAVDTVSHAFFGWGFFIIPVALGLLGAAFIKSISRRIYLSAVVGTVLFMLAFLGMFFIVGEKDFSERLVQGGYLGVIFGYPLLSMLGLWAAAIVLVAVMFVSVLLTLNIPIYRLAEFEDKEKPMDKVVIKHGDQPVADDKRPVAIAKPAVQAKPVKTEMTDREFVIKHLKTKNWLLPPLDLLHADQDQAITGDINANAAIIKRTFGNFGIDVEMGEVSVGPTVTQFTCRPAVGVKLSKITVLNPDLSLALAAHPIRIEAPIPGKSLVGIEVPNKKVALIGLRNMFENDEFRKSKYFLPVALGRDVAGLPVFGGLDKMPHILIAGATGTGKSVSINALLLSLLYKHSPEVLKLILVDPKRVELNLFNGIPHLITPVITDTKKVLGALRWAVNEMDRRYDLLSGAKAKDIFSYNTKMTEKGEHIMPFIVVVIDEMADLMASYGRDVEAVIVRLAQMSRAVGIHLVLSTQRPSVEVITGLIKANITSRIALQVASQVDSRTILDMSGAEKLLGRGDMLYQSGDVAKPRRLQGAMVTEKEVKEVVDFVIKQAEAYEEPDETGLAVEFTTTPKYDPSSFGGGLSGGDGMEDGVDDDMYEEAKKVVIDSGKASASLLQRRIRVGYARAARLLDILEEKGIIGPGEGAKPREVYVRPDGMRIDPTMNVETGMNADTPEAEAEET